MYLCVQCLPRSLISLLLALTLNWYFPYSLAKILYLVQGRIFLLCLPYFPFHFFCSLFLTCRIFVDAELNRLKY